MEELISKVKAKASVNSILRIDKFINPKEIDPAKIIWNYYALKEILEKHDKPLVSEISYYESQLPKIRVSNMFLQDCAYAAI